MVEFVLVLIPLLLFVGGVVQLGIGVANWHDLNRIANEGARYAAINEWPNCPRTDPAACNNATLWPNNSLDVYLESEALTQGLEDSVNVTLCYPDDGDASTAERVVGTPIKVRLDAPFTFRAIMTRPDRPECERDHAHRERPAHAHLPSPPLPC